MVTWPACGLVPAYLPLPPAMHIFQQLWAQGGGSRQPPKHVGPLKSHTQHESGPLKEAVLLPSCEHRLCARGCSTNWLTTRAFQSSSAALLVLEIRIWRTKVCMEMKCDEGDDVKWNCVQRGEHLSGLLCRAINTTTKLRLPVWDTGAVAGPVWMYKRLTGQENTCFHLTDPRGNKGQEKLRPEQRRIGWKLICSFRLAVGSHNPQFKAAESPSSLDLKSCCYEDERLCFPSFFSPFFLFLFIQLWPNGEQADGSPGKPRCWVAALDNRQRGVAGNPARRKGRSVQILVQELRDPLWFPWWEDEVDWDSLMSTM